MTDAVSNVASSAAAQAMKDVAANPTLAGAEKAAETAADAIAAAAANASGNPLVSLGEQLFGGQVIHAIVGSIFHLFDHIGVAVPSELAALKAALDKATNGVL